MRIDSKYSIRTIAGEKVMFLQGKSNADLTKIVSFNSTAEFLWNYFKEREFSFIDVSNLIKEHYGIEQERAECDAKGWIDKLVELKIIIE